MTDERVQEAAARLLADAESWEGVTSPAARNMAADIRIVLAALPATRSPHSEPPSDAMSYHAAEVLARRAFVQPPAEPPIDHEAALNTATTMQNSELPSGNLARAYLSLLEDALMLAAVRRIMEMTHAEICVAWTDAGREWDGLTSIQAARCSMIHDALRAAHNDKGEGK